MAKDSDALVGKKRCPVCRQKLPLEAFGFRRNGRPQSYCKVCKLAYDRDRYAAGKGTPEHYGRLNAKRARARDWYEGNAERHISNVTARRKIQDFQ